jgi:hypothetical protein
MATMDISMVSPSVKYKTQQRTEAVMLYQIQGTRTILIEDNVIPGKWTRSEQVATFWVEACSHKNAADISADIIGQFEEWHLTTMTPEPECDVESHSYKSVNA